MLELSKYFVGALQIYNINRYSRFENIETLQINEWYTICDVLFAFFYWHYRISLCMLKVNTSSLQTPKAVCNSFFIWNNWINLSKYLRHWLLRKGHNKKHVLQITSLDPNFTPWKKDKKDRQLCLLNRKLLLKSLQLLCEFRKHGRNMFNFVSLVW